MPRDCTTIYVRHSDLLECIQFNAVYRSNLRDKPYRLWFMLNKRTRIRVMTVLGLSSYEPKGELIGQGSLGGSYCLFRPVIWIKMWTTIFEIVTSYITEISVSSRCCMLFQDDVIHLSNSRDNTQSAVTRMESVMKSKQLEVHPDKTCCVVIGDSGVTNKIKDELLSRPIIYDDFVVKNEVESK